LTSTSHGITACLAIALSFEKSGPVNVFYWIDGSFGYGISAGG
jgi:hypothetical protein